MKNLSAEYENYIYSPEWFRKRKETFKIKGKQCERCKKTRRLHVHHMTYENFTHEDIENDLAVLCSYCHDLYHKINEYASVHTTRAFILDIKAIKTGMKNRQPKKKKKVRNYILNIGSRKHMKMSRMRLHNPNNQTKKGLLDF